MAGWHHRLDALEFGWTRGVGDEQGGLACCDSWGHKESDTTEWLIRSESDVAIASQVLIMNAMRGTNDFLIMIFNRPMPSSQSSCIDRFFSCSWRSTADHMALVSASFPSINWFQTPTPCLLSCLHLAYLICPSILSMMSLSLFLASPNCSS